MNLHSQDTSGRDRDEPAARARIRGRQAIRTPDDDTVDVSALFRSALAQKKTILFVTLLFAAFAVLHVMYATPRYTATASLVLRQQEQNVLNFQNVIPGASPRDFLAMNTELLILKSDTLLGRVVDSMSLVDDREFNPRLAAMSSSDEPAGPSWTERIGLSALWDAIGWTSKAPEPLPTAREIRRQAIDILRRKLSIAMVPDTYAIEVSIEANAPDKAANIANRISELYIAEQLETKFTAMDDAMVWLGERVAELKEELETAEGKVRQYAANATVITEEGLLFETERLKRLREDLSAKERTEQELRERLARLGSLRRDGDFRALSSFTIMPELQTAARELAESGDDEAALRRFETAFDRRVQALRSEIGRAERQVRSLEQGVEALESELEVRSSDFVRLQQLQREAEATRLIYEHSLG
ncbi:MAG: Wzz/FepE/Etk N-terminal domain-containing protein, partial [Rhodovibrionaceae bacterium]|nr:Wzz/FepE/Etk N-terminal domain-containing protein [Rhodovibrionaceae bacterium]